MLKSASCGGVLPFSPRSDPIGCLLKKRGRAACRTKDTLCLCLSVCGPTCGRYIHRSHKCPVCKYEHTCTFGESSPHKGLTLFCSTRSVTAAAVAHPDSYIYIGAKQRESWGDGGLAGHLVCLINGSELLSWVLWYKWWWWWR